MYLAVADGNQVLNMGQWVSLRRQLDGSVAIVFPTYSYVFFTHDTSQHNVVDRDLLVQVLHARRDEHSLVTEYEFEQIYLDAVLHGPFRCPPSTGPR